MGRGASKAGAGGAGGANANNQFAGYKIDANANAQLQNVIDSVQPNLYGRYLAADRKKIGKEIDKLLNVGDRITINDFVYEKFQNGWFTHPQVNGGGGSFDIADLGSLVTNLKNTGVSVNIYRKS